ncbi:MULTISPECIES: hypothetical protein [unclassified Nostoc]|uniref:hypothetical protein n=1 Tax=unclassified Nostoc TaxID=2593658 RepID=UPI0015E3AA9C|nr:hypothetical protein [Nostoc sp. 'Peltigera membranacea cyanobiont' N6]
MGADGLQIFLAHLSSYLRSGFWEAIARSQLITAATSNPCIGDRRPQKIKHVFFITP